MFIVFSRLAVIHPSSRIPVVESVHKNTRERHIPTDQYLALKPNNLMLLQKLW